MSESYLRIGRISRPHGVRGDVKVEPDTDDMHRFATLHEAYLEQDGAYRPVSVSGARELQNAVALHLGGVDTCEAAEALRGFYLCVDRAHAVPLPEGRFFITDLIGCEVSDTAGKRYGRITDVLQYPANDVYEIEHGRLLVPALKRVLHEVAPGEKRMVLDAAVLMEVGLFED